MQTSQQHLAHVPTRPYYAENIHSEFLFFIGPASKPENPKAWSVAIPLTVLAHKVLRRHATAKLPAVIEQWNVVDLVLTKSPTAGKTSSSNSSASHHLQVQLVIQIPVAFHLRFLQRLQNVPESSSVRISLATVISGSCFHTIICFSWVSSSPEYIHISVTAMNPSDHVTIHPASSDTNSQAKIRRRRTA